MRWELRAAESTPVDPAGLGGFLKRLEQEIAPHGPRLGGFRFFQDAREMLRFSRTIEAAVRAPGRGCRLYTGFQNAGKLRGEIARYRDLREAGVEVIAFGEGQPDPLDESAVAEWNQLESDRDRLENQWYLVTQAPAPIAFVGWEVSPDDLWGQFGVATPGKQFAGFVSDDERVVAAIVRHLDEVRIRRRPDESASKSSLTAVLNRLAPERVLSLADDGRRRYLQRGLRDVVEACRTSDATLYLYDLSAASYLVNPYPDGDARWRRPLDGRTLSNLGRDYLAGYIQCLEELDISVRGILPDDGGFGRLGVWCEAERIDAVVLPVEFVRPSLLNRLAGYTLDSLRAKTKAAIVVDDPDNGAWLVASAEATRKLVA